MSSRKEGAALVGAGVAACAVCCAGSIGGILAAIGLGTAVGVSLYGAAALAVGAILVVIVVVRRRRRIGDREPAVATVVLTIGRRPAPAEPSSSSNDL